MTISAKIIADSISNEGIRLTTLQLRYPRFIHAEFMTHRVFSRNASSSRAIPVERLIEDVMRDTAMPIHWGKNQKGMQAVEENNASVKSWMTGEYNLDRANAWADAAMQAINAARAFADAGYHKQIVNRLLEPFTHINVVVTATEWSNFFHLRDHEDAQPEIRGLARVMKAAMMRSTPRPVAPGQWHLPYVPDDEGLDLETAIMCSVARCARVSYLTHDGKKPDVAADVDLYQRLVGAEPLHASPTEHQASPDTVSDRYSSEGDLVGADWDHGWLHGNFKGWIQYRKTLKGENYSYPWDKP